MTLLAMPSRETRKIQYNIAIRNRAFYVSVNVQCIFNHSIIILKYLCIEVFIIFFSYQITLRLRSDKDLVSPHEEWSIKHHCTNKWYRS